MQKRLMRLVRHRSTSEGTLATFHSGSSVNAEKWMCVDVTSRKDRHIYRHSFLETQTVAHETNRLRTGFDAAHAARVQHGVEKVFVLNEVRNTFSKEGSFIWG